MSAKSRITLHECYLLPVSNGAGGFVPGEIPPRRWSPGVDWLVSVDRLAMLSPWSDSEVARQVCSRGKHGA